MCKHLRCCPKFGKYSAKGYKAKSRAKTSTISASQSTPNATSSRANCVKQVSSSPQPSPQLPLLQLPPTPVTTHPSRAIVKRLKAANQMPRDEHCSEFKLESLNPVKKTKPPVDERKSRLWNAIDVQVAKASNGNPLESGYCEGEPCLGPIL